MARRLPLAFFAAALAFGLGSAGAAPKHDKHEKHEKHESHERHGNDDDVTVDLRGPSIDIGRVRLILGDNRDLIGPAQSLPPGIRKNLARGKPLPPGIAKRFDNRLLGQLPHYDGYEWRQVGTDVVLVALASGLIYEIIENVLD
ncbi:anti-virulence regulator CigR family protein [Pseudomonas subflava]|uniref:anti-virulence regulator CigR family protein n=1 Tax=Pseudomonas subflava TaxID=2952933 RepID=UPI002079A59E|nr:anti-virulence regulator CigR family protein [Pseudomonas subflava]